MSGFTNIHDKAINRVVDVNCHILTVLHVATKQQHSQPIADFALNQAAKRTRAKSGIVARSG